jgi:hypothetical protein
MCSRIALILTSLLIFGLLSSAADKKTRAWQEGKLVSMEKTHELQGTNTTTNSEGKVKSTSKGDKYESQSTSTETPNYDDFMVYTIEAGDNIYTAKQRLNFPWSKTANVNVGGNVQFAVEKNKIYLKDGDGKELSASIVRVSTK